MIPLPSRERGILSVGFAVALPCGYCLQASMTDPATLWIPAYAGMTGTVQHDGTMLGASFSPSPLIPLPSRERGFGWLGCLIVALPCGYCLKASMTDLAVGLSCFTLCSQCQALGQALILCRQGRGGFGWLGLLSDRAPHLWIADQVRNDGPGCWFVLPSPCPVDSRLRGNDGDEVRD